MKRFIQLTFLGVFASFTGIFAQVSTSKWQAQPIVIDGQGADWTTLPRFFNADSNVKYEFRNDAQNLYLILKSADRATQTQLIRAGFSVKLKVKTSPPIKVGITFPGLTKGEMMPMMNNQDGRMDKLMDKTATEPAFMPKDTAFAEGFQFSKGKIISESTDEKSICFARSKSIHELASYEIRIPLREIFGNDYSLETVSNTPIQLQVVINDLSKSQNTRMKGRMSGGSRSGGMRGGGGRGMGGGSRGEGEMRGNNENGSSEIGEMPGSETSDQMRSEAEGGMRGSYSMERKSFSIDFKLSTGK